jgi:hypothetical protein
MLLKDHKQEDQVAVVVLMVVITVRVVQVLPPHSKTLTDLLAMVRQVD